MISFNNNNNHNNNNNSNNNNNNNLIDGSISLTAHRSEFDSKIEIDGNVCFIANYMVRKLTLFRPGFFWIFSDLRGIPSALGKKYENWYFLERVREAGENHRQDFAIKAQA